MNVRVLWNRDYRPGDWVVFRKPKCSSVPGRRARHVFPAQHGEEYFYEVEKYWVVEEVAGDHLIVRTRRGKRHLLEPDDNRLRRATLWERLLHKGRFPTAGEPRRMLAG